MTIAIISHPDCLLHDMGLSHPEQPARIQVIDQTLKQSNLKPFLKKYEAPRATKEQLMRVHDPDYIETIFQIAPRDQLIALDADTLMNPFTLNAALRSAGALILAVDLVMNEKLDAAFCNIRPPGHHAEHNLAMGFCFFNNIAVGVAHALSHYQLERAAIIDFDVHHGNGTEDIFQEDERVLLCSSFQHPFYPFRGDRTQSTHVLNSPLQAGSTGQDFRKIVNEEWLAALHKFKPQMIFVSAGFDAHRNDAMANLAFIEEDYYWISQQIRELADQYAEGRIVSALEGGYDLPSLGQSVVAHLKGLTGLLQALKR